MLEERTRHMQWWDEAFRGSSDMAPMYDMWLDKHRESIIGTDESPVLDLGCGSGNNTLYLLERGVKVISCDFSREALKKVTRHIPGSAVKQLDLLDALPFPDGCTGTIVADLCLHYFTWPQTTEMLKEMGRVLTVGGTLLGRVNSVNDLNYGAGKGTEIERNYYEDGKKHRKRFFDERDIRALFAGWDVRYLKEDILNRYGAEKHLWEFAVRKEW